MDLHTFSDTLTPVDAERLREHMDRVQREEREWAEARLHRSLHGNWLGPDECATCIDDQPDENREGDPAFNGAFNRW